MSHQEVLVGGEGGEAAAGGGGRSGREGGVRVKKGGQHREDSAGAVNKSENLVIDRRQDRRWTAKEKN